MCIRHLQFFICAADPKNPHPKPGERAAHGRRPGITVHSEDEPSGKPVHKIETWTRCAHPRTGHLCASYDRPLELTLEWHNYQCPACHPRDADFPELVPLERRVDRLLAGDLPFGPDATVDEIKTFVDHTPAVWSLEAGERLPCPRLRKDLLIYAESYVDALLILAHKIFVLDRHRRSSGEPHPIIDWSEQDLAEIAMYVRAETLCGRAAGTCGEKEDEDTDEKDQDKDLDSDVIMNDDDDPLPTSKSTRRPKRTWRPALRARHQKHGYEHLGNAAAGWRSRAAADVLASCKPGSLRDLQFPAQTVMPYPRAVVQSGGLPRWRRMALVRCRVEAEFKHLQTLGNESGPSAWTSHADNDDDDATAAQRPRISTEERLAARFKLACWVSVIASFDPGLSDDAAVLVGEYAAQILNPWPSPEFMTASLVQQSGTLLEKLDPVALFAEKTPRPTAAMRRAAAEAERVWRPGTNPYTNNAPYPPLAWYHRATFQLERINDAACTRQAQLTATTTACFGEMYAHRLSPEQVAEALDEGDRCCKGCHEEYGQEGRSAVRLPCCGYFRCDYCCLDFVLENQRDNDARVGSATKCPVCPHCDAPMERWFAPVEESKTTRDLIGSVFDSLEGYGDRKADDGARAEG